MFFSYFSLAPQWPPNFFNSGTATGQNDPMNSLILSHCSIFRWRTWFMNFRDWSDVGDFPGVWEFTYLQSWNHWRSWKAESNS